MTEATQKPARPEQSPRVIGSLSGFAIVAGSMLGIGIFLMPAEVIGAAPDVGWFLGLWLLGGVIAWAGAVAFAELGAMMPEAGGDYVFQREALGPSVAFASGWVLFAAIFSGSLASMAVALFQYQAPVLLGLESSALTDPAILGRFSWAQLGGVGLIVGLTALNSTGTRQSAATQILLTLVPLILFGAISLGIVLLEPATIDSLMTQVMLEQNPVVAASDGVTLTGVVAAYSFVYFAYSGWNSVVYVSGEVKKPGKTLPRVLLTGTGVVTALYIVMCLAFLAVLGAEGIAALKGGVNGTYDAGSALGMLLGGETGTTIVTLLIALALIAGLNGTVLGGARVGYAMAKGGAFWQGAARLSPRSKVPMRALWLQAGWTCVIILSGRFDEIVDMTAVAMIITGSLTVLSLFALRAKDPLRERPYRATLYPWLPGLYLVMSAVVIVVKVSEALGNSDDDAWYPLLGVGVLALAYATHRLWWKNRQHAVAVLAVFVIGGGLLIARGAGANQRLKTSAPAAETDYAALTAGALAASSSEESKSVRLLYETVACRSATPPIDVPKYAKYCKRFKRLHATYDAKTKSKAGPWIAARRPAGLPKTVLYPFSGADLVSSVLAFPDAVLHIHMSLEHGGPVGRLEKLAGKDRYPALQSVMDATAGLLTLSDSKTRHLRLAHETELPGKLPITLAALAAHDAEVIGIRYINVNGAGQVTYYKPGELVGKRLKMGHFTRMDARWSNFELSFRLPGDKTLRVLQHMVVNLHNSHLRKQAGILAWLKGHGKVSFMTKAATYLLWSGGFSEMASIAMDQAAWMITDASGVLPDKLARNGWEATPYGSFRCDLLKWHEKGGAWKKANDQMKRFFATKSAGKLDFRFGYVDCMNRPSIVIATRKK